MEVGAEPAGLGDRGGDACPGAVARADRADRTRAGSRACERLSRAGTRVGAGLPAGAAAEDPAPGDRRAGWPGQVRAVLRLRRHPARRRTRHRRYRLPWPTGTRRRCRGRLCARARRPRSRTCHRERRADGALGVCPQRGAYGLASRRARELGLDPTAGASGVRARRTVRRLSPLCGAGGYGLAVVVVTVVALILPFRPTGPRVCRPTTSALHARSGCDDAACLRGRRSVPAKQPTVLESATWLIP